MARFDGQPILISGGDILTVYSPHGPDLLPGELVHIVDVTNGARLETYTIAGERGSGVIGINGAAARLVQPGDIVILDNLGSHKAAAIGKIIRAAGARLWFLPPYSPDLNPIEQAFAKIKHWMRAAQKRSIEDTWRHVGTLVQTITPPECHNYFANAGYASTKT